MQRAVLAKPASRVAPAAALSTRVTLAPVALAKSKTKAKPKAKKTTIKTNTGGGFGAARPEPEAAAPQHTFDFPQLPEDLAYEDQAEYFLFVRKTKEGGEPGKWNPLGDITVEAANSNGIEAAVKERRAVLKEYAQRKYIALNIMKQGEALQYGARVQRGPVLAADDEDVASIKPLEVEGKILYTVPAQMQLLSDLQWNMKNKKSEMSGQGVDNFIATEKKKQLEDMATVPKDAPAPAKVPEAKEEAPVAKSEKSAPKDEAEKPKPKPKPKPPKEAAKENAPAAPEPEPKEEGPQENSDGSFTYKF